MIPRVHDNAADFGPLAHVPCASCLTEVLVLVVQVGDLADGSHATEVAATNLARREPDRGEITLFSEQLGRCAGGPNDLATLARDELDVVDRGAERNVLQRQRVPDPCLDFNAGDDDVTNLEAVR